MFVTLVLVRGYLSYCCFPITSKMCGHSPQDIFIFTQRTAAHWGIPEDQQFLKNSDQPVRHQQPHVSLESPLFPILVLRLSFRRSSCPCLCLRELSLYHVIGFFFLDIFSNHQIKDVITRTALLMLKYKKGGCTWGI